MTLSAQKPTKGNLTRRRIVARAARLFNTRGFAGTSIADVLEATGLEKGGLYRHFASKDEIALAAFDHAFALLREHHHSAIDRAASPLDALFAMIDVMAASTRKPALAGGCPILNTAIDSDDAHPALRARAAAAMREWQAEITKLAAAAIEAGQLRADLRPSAIATILISSLEGAIMTTALLRDYRQIDTVAAHLRSWLSASSPATNAGHS